MRAGGSCRAIKMMQVRHRFFNPTSKGQDAGRGDTAPSLGGGPLMPHARLCGFSAPPHENYVRCLTQTTNFNVCPGQ